MNCSPGILQVLDHFKDISTRERRQCVVVRRMSERQHGTQPSCLLALGKAKALCQNKLASAEWFGFGESDHIQGSPEKTSTIELLAL